MFKGAVCRILSLAALMLAPSLAHAGLIQQAQSFTLTSSGSVSSYYNSNSSTNSRTANLLFDGFDSSLGLLTGVELSFASSFSMGGNGSASDSHPYTHYESYQVKVSDFGCGFFWLSPCYETRYRPYYSNDARLLWLRQRHLGGKAVAACVHRLGKNRLSIHQLL